MNVLLILLGAAFFLMIVCLLFLILPYIFHFYMHSCPHCGNIMKYKGLKKDDEEGHYLFHCHHCGAWEQIPKNVFLKNFIYKDYDPLNE